MSDEEFKRQLEEERKRIEIARGEITDSQQRLLDAYFGRVNEVYHNSDEKNRKRILEGLELFVDRMTCSVNLPIFPTHVRKSYSFDSQKALELRKKVYKTRSEFTQALGLGRMCAMIQHYENGRSRPNNPPTGKIPKLYLAWLKEQGYNPYNL